MTLFLTGFAIFVALHFIPSLAPGFRRSLQERWGENVYKGVFAIGNIAAFVLIVVGRGGAATWEIYEPPQWGRSVAYVFILAAFLLFVFSAFKTNVKRFVRHPQLTGVILWAIGHLLVNGDSNSLMFFGGFGVWALVMMVVINRHKGPWQKPDPVPFRAEILPVAIGLAVYVGFVYAHQYVIGVPLVP